MMLFGCELHIKPNNFQGYPLNPHLTFAHF